MEVQSVAIRYPALDQSAGESQGMRPIVFSAEQGLCGATLQMHGNISNPLQAGFDKSQKSIRGSDLCRQATSK